MKNRRISTYRIGENVRKVTRLPLVFLRLKGKLDSRKGVTVPEAYTGKLIERCGANENIEALYAEDILYPIRTEGSQLLTILKRDKESLNDMPDAIPGNTPYDIRRNRENSSKRESILSSINNSLTKLPEIEETIINVNSVLDERITKTRRKALATINVYVSGVRSGKLPDFSPAIEFSEDAKNIYDRKHKTGDERIFKAVAEELN